MLGEVTAGDGVSITDAETAYLIERGQRVTAGFGPGVFTMKRTADNAASAVMLLLARVGGAEAADGTERTEIRAGLHDAAGRGAMADFAFDHLDELAPLESVS